MVILVVAMLLLTTIAVSPIFCDGESSEGSLGEFSWQDGSGDDNGTCGSGHEPGPGGPQ